MPDEPHWIRAEQAPQVWQWLTERGGVHYWKSIDICNPDGSAITPILDDDGKTPLPHPGDRFDIRPARVYYKPEDILVAFDTEMHRIRARYWQGPNGPEMHPDDMERVQDVLAGEREGAYPVFHPDEGIVAIWVPTRVVNLLQWATANGLA